MNRIKLMFLPVLIAVNYCIPLKKQPVKTYLHHFSDEIILFPKFSVQEAKNIQ